MMMVMMMMIFSLQLEEVAEYDISQMVKKAALTSIKIIRWLP